jgi:hypothetical protein
VLLKNNNLYRLSGGRGGHAIAYNKSIYTKILNDTENITSFIRKHRALDLYLSRFVQRKCFAYIAEKTIFTQQPGVSNISGGFRNWENYIIDKFEYFSKLPSLTKKRNKIFQKILPIIWLLQCFLRPRVKVVK